MKILLCTLNSKYIHSNLAIRLLYQLNKNHDGLDWKEFTIKEDVDEIAAYCSTYDVIAFSCYIWNILQTLEVTQKIKLRNPKCKILLGGPEVSYENEHIITRNDIDYIICGEGEIPFREFIRSFPDISLVPGLIFKTEKGIKKNAEPPKFATDELATILPYSNDPPEDLKNKILYIETSRGCPYKCEFCLASLDNKVRYLPNLHIRENLLYLMNHGRVIKFLDRTFNLKKEFTISLFQFILDNHKPGNVFQFEITADILHPEIIQFINEKIPAGLLRFEIGIQTVNQKANLAVSRKQNFEKTKSIIQQLRHKIEMHLDLIVGLPLDTFDDIKYSVEEVFKLHPPELQLGFLKFLRGTPVREKYLEHGFVFDDNPPYQIIRSNYLSEKQLHQITLIENMLEIFWNKKKCINTLKYISRQYSIFDFFLFLGIEFEKHHDVHKHSLTDAFQSIIAYIEIKYSHDKVLRDLLKIDYYLYSKIKPLELFPILKETVSRNEVNSKKSKLRHIHLDISFNFEKWIMEERIEKSPEIIQLQFDGENKPQVITETTITNQIV